MLIDNVRAVIKKYRLLQKGERVIVGVSGGPDSVALIYILNSLSREFNLSLHMLHVDHKLRTDSFKDRKFVVELARKLNLPFTVEEVNLKLIKTRGSLEELARNIRLKIFLKTCKKNKTNKIALGHNLDDQAETVLMRMLRGSGLYGLAAMTQLRKIQGLEIIRPLLETRRREIETFLKRRGISPCQDSTNKEEVFFRNKIRSHLIPLLEKEYNPNIKGLLSNMAATIGQDYDFIKQKAEKEFSRFDKKIPCKKFIKLHPAIQMMILRLNISKLKGQTRQITYGHIKELQELILSRPENSIVDLPANISARKKSGIITFYTRTK
ncbi:MAG: tRNA lysidine(34) synthetase TilS [Candidatus Omnitrophota bacterium]